MGWRTRQYGPVETKFELFVGVDATMPGTSHSAPADEGGDGLQARQRKVAGTTAMAHQVFRASTSSLNTLQLLRNA